MLATLFSSKRRSTPTAGFIAKAVALAVALYRGRPAGAASGTVFAGQARFCAHIGHDAGVFPESERQDPPILAVPILRQ